MKQQLPEYIQNYIQKYKELQLGGKQVICPYYMNLQQKKDLRSMLGKGTPEEIEMEARIWEKVKGVNFNEMNEKEIREFMMARGIGIDCSGFIAHIVNEWYKYETNKYVWSKLWTPRKNILNWIGFKLRPIEKISANYLTNSHNAYPISTNDVKPGDLIRLKWKKRNAHHILLVSEVERNENNTVTEIKYVQSTRFYGENNGVKEGSITIIDVNQPLEKQQWNETDEHGVNFTYEGYLVQLEDNGLRRLKVLEEFLQ